MAKKIRTLEQLNKIMANNELTFSLSEALEILEEFKLRLQREQNQAIGITSKYFHLEGLLEAIDTSISLLTRIDENKLPEIKPCPFCGSTEIDISLDHDCYSSLATIKCKKCRAKKEIIVDKPHSVFPDLADDWKEKVINSWNERLE